MKFQDKRSGATNPVSPSLLQLRDEIIARHEHDAHSEYAFIMANDYDVKIGTREHLQMNFEPQLDKAFKCEWFLKTSRKIHVVLLENTPWKRLAWAVYETGLRDSVIPGVYRHFKGNLYHVLGVAEDTESRRLSVIYIPQYGEYEGKLSCRPLAMFVEEVEKPEYHYKGPRFALVEAKSFILD